MRAAAIFDTIPPDPMPDADPVSAIASMLVPPPTHALIAMLRRVLGEHNPLEDAPGGLYDRCDEAGDTARELLERMRAIPPARASEYLDEPRIHEHIARMLAARERPPGR